MYFILFVVKESAFLSNNNLEKKELTYFHTS